MSVEKKTAEYLIRLVNKVEGASEIESAKKSYSELANSLNLIAERSQPAKTWLDKLGTTILNTFRYQVVNQFTDALLNGAGEIVNYLKEVDQQLNSIRIVSGQTQSQVEGFLKTAQQGAKALGTTTTSYLEAAQIFYQQGLSTSEVIARTNETVKAANISGQSISETADQVTAVLNGYNISASEVNDTLSIMASLGAATASDFEELASASQKVASASSNAGIPLKNMMAMIATMTSVTREAPESIGTSLNSLIGRFNDLDIDDLQQVSSTIEGVLQNTGTNISIFNDETGQIRNLNSVLTDLADIWDTIDGNSKAAITTALAGTRQANRLLALLDNWDAYQKNLKTADIAEGSLDAQQAVYMESLEAMENQMEAASMTMWGELFNEDYLKSYYKTLTDVFTTTGNIIDNIGGAEPILRQLSAIAIPLLSKLATPIAVNIGTARARNSVTSNDINIKEIQNQVRNLGKENGGEVFRNISFLNQNQLSKLSQEQQEQYSKSVKVVSQRVELQEKLAEASKYDPDTIRQLKDELIDTKEYNEILKDRIELEKELEAVKQKRAVLESKVVTGDPYKNLKDQYGEAGLNAAISKQQSGKGLKGYDYAKLYKDLGISGNKEEQSKVKEALNYYAKTTIDAGKENEKYANQIKESREKEAQIQSQLDQNTEDLRSRDSDFYSSDLFGDRVKTLLESGLGADRGQAAINSLSEDLFAKIKQNSSDSSIVENNFTRLLNLIDDFDNKNLATADILKKYNLKEEDLNKLYEKLVDTAKKVTVQVNAEADNAQKQIDANNTRTKQAVDFLAGAKDAITSVSVAEWALSAVNAVWSLGDAFLQMSDDSVEGTQKVQIGIQGIGTALSSVASMFGPWGMVAATGIGVLTSALTYFAETFQWGASEAEKAANRINSALSATEGYTKTLLEQKNALSSVSLAADELAEKYKEQAFTRDQLTEAEKTSYDQVASYVKTYAPELVKYYDLEGNAIIDLSRLYGTLGENRRNYLDQQYLDNAYQVYGSDAIQENIGTSASALLTQQQLAYESIRELNEQIVELQQKALTSNRDYTDEITAATEKLQEQQNLVTNISTNWDELVAKPITYGSSIYQSLSPEGQTLMTNLASYNNYLDTGFGALMDTDSFSTGVQNFMQSLVDSGNSVQEKFLSMDQSIQLTVADMAMSMNLTNTQLQQLLPQLDQASFLSGEFLGQWIKAGQENIDENSTVTDISKVVENLDKIEEPDEEEFTRKATKDVAEDYAKHGAPIASSYAAGYDDKLADDIAEKTEEYTEEFEDQQERQVDAVKDATDRQKDLYDEMFNSWSKGVREFANSSAENYQEVRKEFEDLQESMSSADEETRDDIAKRAGALYSILRGDDKAYYKEWLGINQSQVAQAAEQYGVLASNYKTYNEYMNALDVAQANARIILENNAGKSIAEIGHQLTNEKLKQMSVEALQAGKTAEAEIFAAATSSDSQKVASTAAALVKLEGYRESLQAAVNAGQGEALVAAETNNAIIDTYNQAVSQLEGGKTISQVAARNVTYSQALGLVDQAIADLTAAAQEDPEVSGEMASIEQAMKDYADFVLDPINWQNPTGNFDTTGFKDYVPSAAPSYTSPAGGSGGGGDSGGGSGGSSKSETPKTDLVDLTDLEEGEVFEGDIDVLKPYTDQIEELEHQLDLLSEARDHAYGKGYMDILEDELSVQEETLDVMKEKLKAAQDSAAEQKKNLEELAKEKDIKLSFDDNGAISNYNDILKSLEESSQKYQDDYDKKKTQIDALTAQYDALKAQYEQAEDAGLSNEQLNVKANALNNLANQINKLTEEANKSVADQSALNEWAENFKDRMDDYEEMAVDNIQEMEEDISSQISDIIENQIEQIEYPINIVVEASEQNEDYLDLLSSILTKNKGKVSFSVDSTASFNSLQNTLNEINGLFKNSDKLQEAMKAVEDIQNNAEITNLYSAPGDLLELLRDQESTMIDAASQLIEIENEMSEAFDDAIDSAVETLEDALDRMADIADVYSNVLEAAEQTNSDTFELIQKMNTYTLEVNEKQISALKEQAQTLLETRDQYAKGTDEYLKADEAYIESLNKIVELQKESVSAMEDTISNLFERNKEEIESTILGTDLSQLKEDLQDLTAERDKYLATEKKIYELSKFESSIAEDIDSYQNNPTAQKRLQQFMDAELKYLREKEKITQDDLDLSQKQYDLLKAQIELEDARAGKNYTQMLQRNSSGNYGYVYVADTSAIDEAEQAYQDAIDQLYEYASSQYDSYLNDITDAVSEYEEDVQDIAERYQKGQITYDKAMELTQQARDKLLARYQEDQQKITEYQQQMAGATELQKDAQDELNSSVEEQLKLLDELINGDTTKTFDQIYEDLTGMTTEDTVFSDLNNGIIDMTSNWNDFFAAVNKDIDTIDFEKIDQNIETIYESIDKYKQLLEDWKESSEGALDAVIDSDIIGGLNGSLGSLNDATKTELETVNETIKKYQEQSVAIENTTNKLLQMIEALESATGKIEETFGVTADEGLPSITDTIEDFSDSTSTDTILASLANSSDMATRDMLMSLAQVPNSNVNSSSDTYNIHAEFPNATSTTEILDAFDTLSNYTAQYLGNNKNQ